MRSSIPCIRRAVPLQSSRCAFVAGNREYASTCTDIDASTHPWRRRRVVVTGLGAITPLGCDMQSTWRAVLRPDAGEGSSGTGITSLHSALKQQGLSDEQFEREWGMLQSLSCQVAASVNNEWITNHPLQSADAKPAWLDGRTSRFVQLALIAAQEAIRNAKLDEHLGLGLENDGIFEKRRERIGASIGNGMSSTRDIAAASRQSLRKISPHFVPRILPNSPAARIAMHHNLLGPNLSHSEACAAGAAAIAQAVELIQSGRANGMVAGGCESAVEALGLGGFGRLRALSSGRSGTDHESQSEEEEYRAAQAASRPFDAKRNGFVLAEGAAMLVLEERDHAVERGAPILAEVLGVGYSGDAFHITAPEPSGTGASRAMLNAVEDAEISMNAVDYVNTHATSTPIGDVAECNAIRLALSRTGAANEEGKQSPLLVSSTKGATGHLLGAVGAIEAALTVLSVSEDTIPHTRNLEDVSDDIAQVLAEPSDASSRTIRLVKDQPISQPIASAISNSFGFGGTNVSLLFGKTK